MYLCVRVANQRSTWFNQEARGGREVHVKARVPGEPVLDGGRLVRAVVVHHQVDVQRSWHVGLDGAQELQEFAAAVASVHIANDGSGGDVQGAVRISVFEAVG
jgi:hypothetical protein